MTTVKEALGQAERLILVDGFTQGEWGNEVVGYCLDGALLKMCGGDSFSPSTFQCSLLSEARTAVERVLRAQGFVDPLRPDEVMSGMRYLYRYNDQPGRTKEEVLDVLRVAQESA